MRTREERRRDLARDLDLLESGWMPDDRMLLAAPILERWTFIWGGGAVCLEGLSYGHPELPGEGRLICTSPVIAMDVDRVWARTFSRWYRLGTPRR
jgi:hypothetical protein